MSTVTRRCGSRCATTGARRSRQKPRRPSVVALSRPERGPGTKGHEDLQSDFRVETHMTGRVTTLTVGGELDLLSSPALEQELERAHASDCDVILIDLRELEFMDSTGLHVLVKA